MLFGLEKYILLCRYKVIYFNLFRNSEFLNLMKSNLTTLMKF